MCDSLRLNSETVGQFVVEIIVTFFLGVLIEGVSYFRYNFLVRSYADAAKTTKEG